MRNPTPTQSKRPSLVHRAASSILSLTIAGALVAVIMASITALHTRANSDPALAAYPPITVSTIRSKQQPAFEIASQYVGRIEAARETPLAFERPGLVTHVRFEEGEKIDRGNVIARLDTSLLDTQLQELEAQKREIEARRDLAQATLARQSNLNRQGWSPEQRYDEARFRVAELTASLQRLAANISAVRINLQKSQIRAPFAGTAGRRDIDEGTVVAAGTNVLTLIESQQRRVRVGLPPNVAAGLEDNADYTVTISGKMYSARLFTVRPDLETGTRTVTAIFTITGADAAPLGEIAMLDSQSKVTKPGTWLPIAALTEGQKGLWSVFILDETKTQHTVSRIAVDILHTDKSKVFVAGNIPNNAAVVIAGTNRITPGQRVAANQAE